MITFAIVWYKFSICKIDAKYFVDLSILIKTKLIVGEGWRVV